MVGSTHRKYFSIGLVAMGEARAEGAEVISLSGVDTLCVGDLRQLRYSTATALLIAPLPSFCVLPSSLLPSSPRCGVCVSEFQLRRIITSLLSCGYDLQEMSATG